MKILFLAPIDPSLPQGHAAHTRHLAEAFGRIGHELRLISLHPEAGVCPWPGPDGGWRTVERRGLPTLRQLAFEARLARALREERIAFRPDVLLVRQELMSLSALWERGEVCGRVLGYREEKSREPLCVESNSSLAEHVRRAATSRPRGGIKERLAPWVEGRLLRAADMVACVTDRLAADQARRHRLDPARVATVPNGAALPDLDGRRARDLRRQLGAPDDVFLAMFIGNLSLWQGLEILPGAMARTDDRLMLWVVGEGESASDLERQIRSRGIGARVRLLGAMPEERALLLAQAAEVLVAPYEPSFYERAGGDGLKVLQGMACDRPVLTSSAAAVSSAGAIGTERVAAWTEEAWADALMRWEARWRADGAPLSGWPWPEGEGPGRRLVATTRTWDHSARAWEKLFDRALSLSGRTS